MPSKVYFVTRSMKRVDNGALVPAFDYSAASSYGEAVFLLDHDDAENLSCRELFNKLADGLFEFSQQDFLVPVGNQTAISIAAIIASDYCGGYVNFLHWEKKSGKYVEFALNLSQMLPQ